MVKPATKPPKSSIAQKRKALFKEIHRILSSHYETKSVTDTSIIKKQIKTLLIKFQRSTKDDFLQFVDLDLPQMLTLSEQLKDCEEGANIHQIIKNTVEAVIVVAVKPPKPMAKTLRDIMTMYLRENPDWEEKSLKTLLDRLELPNNKRPFPTILTKDEEAKVMMIMNDLYHSPHLPIPRELVNEFLLTSEFIRNTEGDVDTFIRKYSIEALMRAIEEELDQQYEQYKINGGGPLHEMPVDETKMMKRISPILEVLYTSDRKLYKVKFFDYSKVLQMITVYNGNILSLDDVVNKIITGREALKAGLDPKIFRKTILIDEKGNILSTIVRQKKLLYNTVPLKPSKMEGPRPIMYMILRPWVKNMKEFTISSSHKAYLGDLAHVDTEQWYYPTNVFYEASTHPSGSQKDKDYMMDGHKVRIRYETFDGRIFEQDKDIFEQEKRFFETSPMYDVPFLERAFSGIKISVLDIRLRLILETMAKDILSSAFGCILNSYHYNLSMLSEMVLKYIFENSITIENFFDNIYKVVYRLDKSICPVAVLHKIHHRRLRNFFYQLSDLQNLTNGLAFIEMSFMSPDEQLMVKNMVKVSRDIFYMKNIHSFKTIVYPTLRSQTSKKSLPILPSFNVEYPNVREETFFSYMLPKNPEVLRLDVVAASEENGTLFQQTEKYFDLDFVTYMGELDTSLFCTYPVYYLKNPLAQPLAQPLTQPISQKPDDDFWDRFEEYLTSKELKPPGKKPNVIKIENVDEPEEEQEEELGEEVAEEADDDQPFDEEDIENMYEDDN